MTQPIYKHFMLRPTAAWRQLSQPEQQALLGRGAAALEQVGGKSIVVCDSAGATEQWPLWGVEQYPDLDALQKHTQLHEPTIAGKLPDFGARMLWSNSGRRVLGRRYGSSIR